MFLLIAKFHQIRPEKYDFNLYEGFFREKVARIRQILKKNKNPNRQICTVTTSQSDPSLAKTRSQDLVQWKRDSKIHAVLKFPERDTMGQNEVSRIAISGLKRGPKNWSKRGLKICHSGLKRDLKTCHSWPKRDPKTWWKSRGRGRARREGSEEGRCCSDGASAGAAASFTVQARPSPVFCRCKKCLPPRHVIVLLGLFFLKFSAKC